MNSIKTAKIISTIVILISIMVMVGWLLNIELFKSILPIWVTMKFSTAFCFFLSGLALFFLPDYLKTNSEIASLVISAASLIILILMMSLLISVFTGTRTGIEDFVVSESDDAIKTTTPGRPSAGTMMSFILLASISLTSIFKKTDKKYLLSTGVAVIILGSSAIIGYFFNIPSLYYSITDISTAMAVHTAVLFVLLGACFIFCKDINQIN